jgi:hypothetical protein
VLSLEDRRGRQVSRDAFFRWPPVNFDPPTSPNMGGTSVPAGSGGSRAGQGSRRNRAGPEEAGRVGPAEEAWRVGGGENARGQRRKQIGSTALEEAVQSGAAEDAGRVADGVKIIGGVGPLGEGGCEVGLESL